MEDKELFRSVKALHLPEGKYVLFGSAPLCVRGMRECKDIDILVLQEVWDEYSTKSDWRRFTTSLGDPSLIKDNLEMMSSWKPGEWDVSKLIREAEIIDGLPFVGLRYVIAWKKLMGREKDLKDIALIENALGDSSTPFIGHRPYKDHRVVGIIISDGKVLLLRRSREESIYYVFPGGGVEKGEDILVALHRELKEELGIDIETEKLLFKLKDQFREAYGGNLHGYPSEYYFLIEHFSGTVLLSSEDSKKFVIEWVDSSKIGSFLNLYPHAAVQKLLEIKGVL